MLLDQRKTRRMAQIAAIIAALGFAGIIVIVVVVLVVQGGPASNDPVKLAQKETKAHPKDPVAWDNLEAAYFSAQKLPEAQQAAQTAFDLRPNGTRLETLATLMDQNGQTAQAFKVAQEFTATHPKDAQGFLLFGALAEKTAKKNVALLAYATFVRLAPNDPVAQTIRARIQFLQHPVTTTTKGTTTTATPTTPSVPPGTPAKPVTP